MTTPAPNDRSAAPRPVTAPVASAREADPARREAVTAWLFVAPALAAIVLIAIFPLGWTAWESLHLHDLRMPWLGRPLIGLGNYGEALSDARFRAALGHTAFFTATTVSIEIALGLAFAMAMDHAVRARGAIRAAVILPWAIPTVVSALIWRFGFQGEHGVANTVVSHLGLAHAPIAWLVDPILAWVPLLLADTWKTTPFVALLLLAGLQNIDPVLYEAARIDGAGPWRRFTRITLPLLRPALLVALIFRTLDAVRVFDLVYVLTGGGPGTATEPLALYTFDTLLQDLRFGYGSALSVLIFVIAFGLALLYVRALGAGSREPMR